MLSGYCGAFYIDRKTFCAQMVQGSLRFATWRDFTDDLRRLGITHLIAPTAFATGGQVPVPLHERLGLSGTETEQHQMVRQLLTSHARTLATASDQGLYEIEPALLAEH